MLNKCTTFVPIETTYNHMEKQTETIRTRVSKPISKALTKKAEQEFMTVSSLIRKLINKYLTK